MYAYKKIEHVIAMQQIVLASKKPLMFYFAASFPLRLVMLKASIILIYMYFWLSYDNVEVCSRMHVLRSMR